MISIYREEIRDLLRTKKIHDAEDIWLQLLEEDPSDTNLFIGLSIEFANKHYNKEASTLLNMCIPYLLENGYLDRALDVVKQMASITPNDKETSERIIECYSLYYQDIPQFNEIIRVSRVQDATQHLSKSIEQIENFATFKKGDFCKHNSWGIGQIASIDFLTKTLSIDFYARKKHPMDIELGVRALTKIDATHICALKYKKMPYLKKLAANNPVELIIIVLKSFDGKKATLTDITDAIAADVIGLDDWKKWWDKTKKLLKNNPYIALPEKKQKQYKLLDKPVSMDEQILSNYNNLSNFREKITFVSAKLRKQAKNAYSERVYKEISEDLGKIVEINHTLHPTLALESWYTLISLTPLFPKAKKYSKHTAKTILEHAHNLMETINNIEKLEFKKEALKDTKEFFPNRWTDIYLDILTSAQNEIIDEIVDPLLAIENNKTQLQNILKMGYDLITDNEELLVWIAKNLFTKKYKQLLEPFAEIILIEKLTDCLDLLKSGVVTKNAKNTTRISDLLFKNNCSLVNKLLSISNKSQILRVAQTITESSALDKLNKRALLAKFIIHCPDVKDLMKSDEVKSNAIYSSKEAYDQKQKEFYEMVNILIPQNAKNISIAREHGDLRENFEYKAAKEEQAKLMRRKMEFEDLFNKIRIIDTTEIDINKVSIATSVRIKNCLNGEEKVVSIMGIWDSQPEKGIISYLTPLAQGLIGNKVGDEITFNIGSDEFHYKILEIAPSNACASDC